MMSEQHPQLDPDDPGRDMTADEWRWLAHPSTGLKEVRDWLDAAEPQPQRRA